jgi:hypothetical protein
MASPAASAAAAVAGPTAAEELFFMCRHNRAACDKCILAYPPGCLHSLREDERMSAEIKNQVIPAFQRFYQEKDMAFWYFPANAPFANELMVRFIFYQSVKFIVGKDSYHLDDNSSYQDFAEEAFLFMLHLYSVIKCGSDEAVVQAMEEQDVSSLDEAQVSIRALHWAFGGCDSCYYRLVYILNELSPCNCLEMDVNHAQEEDEAAAAAAGRESWMLGWCSNGDCDKKESPDDDVPFSICAGCRMAQYCSRRCYKDHWRGDMTTSTEPSHKIACKAIQELKSVLAGGGIHDAPRMVVGFETW